MMRPSLTDVEIRRVFDKLGLSSPEEHRTIRSIGASQHTEEASGPIRTWVSNGTEPKQAGVRRGNAKLADAGRRD